MKMHTGLDIPLRCRCGHVRGVAIGVAPSTGFRFVCYCKDCQAFARFLGRADATGPLPPNAPPPPSLGVFARRASKLLVWWVRGLTRPTPFFDDAAKAPRSVPLGLTPSERAVLPMSSE